MTKEEIQELWNQAFADTPLILYTSTDDGVVGYNRFGDIVVEHTTETIHELLRRLGREARVEEDEWVPWAVMRKHPSRGWVTHDDWYTTS